MNNERNSGLKINLLHENLEGNQTLTCQFFICCFLWLRIAEVTAIKNTDNKVPQSENPY